VRQLLERQHLAAVGRPPAKHDPDLVELIAHAAREDEAPDPESGQDLRKLERMPEAVGQVPDRRRCRAEALAYVPADQEVAHQRLGPDQQLVGKDVARPDLDPPRLEQRPQPALVVGTDIEVVLEHDRLAVERERREPWVALERLDDAVDDVREPQAEVLERAIPLPVPVGMWHDGEAAG
jgi:hypothetical protein